MKCNNPALCTENLKILATLFALPVMLIAMAWKEHVVTKMASRSEPCTGILLVKRAGQALC